MGYSGTFLCQIWKMDDFDTCNSKAIGQAMEDGQNSKVYLSCLEYEHF